MSPACQTPAAAEHSPRRRARAPAPAATPGSWPSTRPGPLKITMIAAGPAEHGRRPTLYLW